MAAYQIVAVSTRTQERTVMTAEPVTRAEAETMLSKLAKHPCRDLVIEEVAPVDDLQAQRAAMVQDMLDNAAVWRALGAPHANAEVYVDKDQRLVWYVPGRGYLGMQINPNSGRPMVMAGALTSQQHISAQLVMSSGCPSSFAGEFKPQAFGHYCELAAKGSESAAQYLEEMLQGGAQ